MSHKNKKNNQEVVTIKKSKNIWLYLVIAILLISNIIGAIFYFSSDKIVHKDIFNLLNPARKLFAQKDNIVNVQPVRDYLDNKYGKDPDVSIYFEYLNTGANISINKDAEFYPASLLKLPVAMAVAKKIDKGDWLWDNKLVLMSGDKDNKFGTLYKEPTGAIFTIKELVDRSLSDSDNTAHFILLRNLETKEIEEVYSRMGLGGFLDTNGNMSAKRYSVILRTLYNSSYLSDDSSQKLISFMAEGSFGEYLKSGLPEDILFSHKIGIDTDKKVYLDSGIVYLKDRPYILIVMTKEKSEPEAKSIMKDISASIYGYIKNYNK